MDILTPDQIQTLIAAFVAIVAAVAAYLENKKKTTVINAMTSGTVESKDPAALALLPERSWKMSDATKKWCTFDASQENKDLILKRIDAAETQHLTHYQIDFAGGYYIIDFGLLMGGSGNPSGK